MKTIKLKKCYILIRKLFWLQIIQKCVHVPIWRKDIYTSEIKIWSVYTSFVPIFCKNSNAINRMPSSSNFSICKALFDYLKHKWIEQYFLQNTCLSSTYTFKENKIRSFSFLKWWYKWFWLCWWCFCSWSSVQNMTVLHKILDTHKKDTNVCRCIEVEIFYLKLNIMASVMRAAMYFGMHWKQVSGKILGRLCKNNCNHSNNDYDSRFIKIGCSSSNIRWIALHSLVCFRVLQLFCKSMEPQMWCLGPV